MKRIWIGALIALASVACAVEDGFRAFSTKDGRALEARIVEYDAKKGLIQMERRGEGKVWVTPNVFVEADQTYVKEWIAADRFLSTRWMSVTLELKEKKPFNQYAKVEYELNFYNKSDEDIEINGIDFLCLVRRNVKRIDGKDIELLQRPVGLIEVTNESSWGIWENGFRFKLKPGKNSHILQGPLILDEEEHEDEIKGVWVRIKGPQLRGKTVSREVCLPEKIRTEQSWTEVRKTASTDLLNPYRLKKKESLRKAGTKPSDKNEYDLWFYEISREGDYYMHSRPVKLEDAKKSYEELKAFYDPQYESSSGGCARSVAKLAYMVRDYKGCAEWYEISLKGEGSTASRCELSSLYSSGVPGVINAERAIELAKLVVAEDEENHWYLDLLARGYARAGQFDRAIETQEKIIEVLKKKLKKEHLESSLKQPKDRLELYKQGKPYYDQPADFFS